MLQIVFAMKEKIIVSFTSYGKRTNNIPSVLDTIFAQTITPDLVVINLAHDEIISADITNYLKSHNVEINRVPDTKVYKKLLPTLKRYHSDVVINIDDDFLYPEDMIADFLAVHKRHPNNPISGNREVFFRMQCHCGCASLTKAEFFGDYLYQIDDTVIDNCPSDDMVYTFFATKSGHPYLQTEKEYFLNMPEYNADESRGYSDTVKGDLAVVNSYNYLVKRYGKVENNIAAYTHDDDIAKVISNIQDKTIWDVESKIRSSHAYRIGKFLLKPLSWIKRSK